MRLADHSVAMTCIYSTQGQQSLNIRGENLEVGGSMHRLFDPHKALIISVSLQHDACSHGVSSLICHVTNVALIRMALRWMAWHD
jgi:hypothetical protein